MNAPVRTIMGHEIEYAISVFDARGVRLDGKGLELFESVVPTLGPHLPWEDRGFALPNGSKFYRDPASGGAHLELATAEVSNPSDLIAHVEAGHRFVLRAAAALVRTKSVGSVTVSCNSVDFSCQPATCGSHESYLVPVEGGACGEPEDDIPF